MLKRKKVLLIVLTIVITMVVGAGVLYYFVISGSVLKKGDTYIPRNAVNEYSDDYDEKMGNFTAKTTVGALKGKLKNTCYSPISLYSCLSMSAELMTDESSLKVLKSLGYEDMESLEKEYQHMVNLLMSGGDSELPEISLCNSLWLREKKLSEEGQDKIKICEEKTKCEIYNKDFTADEINKWVSEKTKGMIDKVIDNADSSFYLINTLYFKSGWNRKFKTADSGKFTLLTGEKIETKYMERADEGWYIKGKNYISTREAFTDGSSMIFVLPDKDKEVEEIINEKTINEILASYSSDAGDKAEITLTVPKFDFAYDIENEDMEQMLIGAGFDAIYSNDSWKLLCDMDKLTKIWVKQKTKIAIDEKGAEAAAATTFYSIKCAYEEKEELRKIEITLNRPFMYIIVKNDTPLFIGTVYNPNEK